MFGDNHISKYPPHRHISLLIRGTLLKKATHIGCVTSARIQREKHMFCGLGAFCHGQRRVSTKSGFARSFWGRKALRKSNFSQRPIVCIKKSNLRDRDLEIDIGSGGVVPSTQASEITFP